jgi:hypothetical protein
MPGRPSTFTKEVGDRILSAFRTGCYASTAAQSCMVIPKTMLRWVIRGQHPDAPEDMRAFSDEFMAIDATREIQIIKRIQAAADPQEITVARTQTEANGDKITTAEVRTVPGDVNALRWYAERRWPKRWAAPKEGQQPGLEEVQASKIIEEAEGRDGGLDEIFAEMDPELEAAILRNADRIRALLEKAPDEKK